MARYTLPAVLDGPWSLPESQIYYPSINSSTFVEVAAAQGRGWLEEAVMAVELNSSSVTESPEFRITIDGKVVYDVGMATGTTSASLNTVLYGFCLASTVYSSTSFAGMEILQISYTEPALHSSSSLIYPQPTQNILSINETGIIVLNYPLYFASSVLIEAKGISSGFLKAEAKARS